VNLLMAALARSRPGALSGWQVLHQSGEDDNTALENAYTVAGVKAVVTRFVSAMGVWWRAADLAVGRCGAGTVAEAWANGVPAVFLPYPFHRDQHQRANAAPLVSAGAAVVCDDLVSAEANLPVAGAVIADLLTDGARREGMRQSAERLGPADGAERVARALLGLDGVGV
jgi:UDP-N-acetylglucosamine--N-acetylmuramyl-(pentapeptide) pyrophosphoryl-undecaprenol N-acetylglucosamine transferase